MTNLRLIHADAQWLSEHVAPESVDCCVTSPPYFGLRFYRGIDPAIDPGSQDTVEGYIEMLVGIFREVWKVLKPTGSLFVNMGDSMYSGSDAWPYGTSGKGPVSYQDGDSGVFYLCDECQERLRNSEAEHHTSRKDIPLASLSTPYGNDPTQEHMESASQDPDSWDCSPQIANEQSGHAMPGSHASDSLAGELPHGAQVSTNSVSSEQPPGVCCHCAKCGACQSVLCSSSPLSLVCARTGWHLGKGDRGWNEDTLGHRIEGKRSFSEASYSSQRGFRNSIPRYSTNLKPGDLIGTPWRLALALQQDGWTLRMDCIWAKESPMPESVSGWRWERHRVKVKARWDAGHPHPSKTGGINWENHDGSTQAQWLPCPGCPTCEPNGGLVLRRGSWRPTRAHEYLFLFTKGMNYFAEQESVREQAIKAGQLVKASGPDSMNAQDTNGLNDRQTAVGFTKHDTYVTSRNPRSVRSFSRKGDGEKYSHYATFPVSLPEWCIKASTPSAGVCAKCGVPWAPVVERLGGPPAGDHRQRADFHETASNAGSHPTGMLTGGSLSSVYAKYGMPENRVIDYRPTCTCNTEAVPATVLDPFMGTGSTLVAAIRLGRRAIGVDASEEYIGMAQERCRGIQIGELM